ncbi:hypothetical protein [Amycolatopsis magusensis]|uniref:hypothetical protein n=1 Tax=Amycolatopsis magusensis TaxID=882444 RepID=UPI0035574764
MIANALRDAGVLPHEVELVEARGTGTPVGTGPGVPLIGPPVPRTERFTWPWSRAIESSRAVTLP